MRQSKGRLANMSKMSTADKQRIADVRMSRYGKSSASGKTALGVRARIQEMKSDPSKIRQGGGLRGALSRMASEVKGDSGTGNRRGMPPGGPGGKARSRVKKATTGGKNFRRKQGTTKDNVRQHGKSLKGASNYQSNKLIKG